MAMVMLFAAMSWFLVEKPFLRLNKKAAAPASVLATT
jgi:peptidoglycan/LPS O-acetylase OafA/YrhL